MICQNCDDFLEREIHQGPAEELKVLLTLGKCPAGWPAEEPLEARPDRCGRTWYLSVWRVEGGLLKQSETWQYNPPLTQACVR